MQEIKYWLLYGKAKCNILQWKIQCFKQFLLSRIFSILHKNKSSKTCEYQLDEFDDNLVRNDHENNHALTPPKIRLMIAGETMQCRKVRHILRYHVSNKLLAAEEFAHHVLFLFFLFRDVKELLSGFPPLYQNKLRKQEVQALINMNQIKL